VCWKEFHFLNLPCPLGTFDLFFFSSTKRRGFWGEAPQKRKSNWLILVAEGRACIHECMVEGNEEFEHMLFFLFT
jgi:hypothetical protein